MSKTASSTWKRSRLAAVLLVGVLISGCSDGASTAEATATTEEEPTPAGSAAAVSAADGDHRHFNVLADDVRWMAAPALSGLPEGVELALIEGTPLVEGPFTFRLRFQDGARLMPHTHPVDERITVISGSLNQGIGETFDQSATEVIPAGSFVYRSPGQAHFVWFDEETVLQFHGTGPFGIEYVNPADDPRK